jgi:hypothetical protein
MHKYIGLTIEHVPCLIHRIIKQGGLTLKLKLIANYGLAAG